MIRFVLAGGVNTGLTQLLYMALLVCMPYTPSYTLSYIAGIYLAFWLNSRWVFHAPLCWKKALQFPVVYLVQYVLGVVLLRVLIERLGVPEVIAPLVVVILLLPVTFTISRLIIKRPCR
jgi:putative flippase GtrA